MKIFNYLIATCLLLLCMPLFSQAQTYSYTQKRSIKQNDFAIEGGLTYAKFDFPYASAIESAYGIYMNGEKVWKDFGFRFSFNYMISDIDNFDGVNNYGKFTGNYDYQIIFTSLNIGSNWYIISSDIDNDFSPYLGANLMMTVSHAKVTSTTSLGPSLKGDNAINFAIAPTVGLNIPIAGSVGLRLEGQYIIPLLDIEIDNGIKRDFDYFKINLGANYCFDL